VSNKWKYWKHCNPDKIMIPNCKMFSTNSHHYCLINHPQAPTPTNQINFWSAFLYSESKCCCCHGMCKLVHKRVELFCPGSTSFQQHNSTTCLWPLGHLHVSCLCTEPNNSGTPLLSKKDSLQLEIRSIVS
jgi:hypothetical protein